MLEARQILPREDVRQALLDVAKSYELLLSLERHFITTH